MSLDRIFLDLLNNDMEVMFRKIVRDYKDKIPELSVESLNKTFGIESIKRINQSKFTDPQVKPVVSSVNDQDRCMARIWGSTPPIAYYCDKQQKYIYGERCSRPKKKDCQFCGLHAKRQPHGIYGKLPPHEHFEKYLVTEN